MLHLTLRTLTTAFLAATFLTAAAGQAQTPTSARNTPSDTKSGLTTPQNTEPRPFLGPEGRGDLAMVRKNFRQAIVAYQEIQPTTAVLLNKTGIAYHQLMELDLAKKYYEKAIKANPKYAEAMNNLGTVYSASKNFRRAINEYKRALQVDPSSALFYSNLGTAYFGRKEYKEAAETFQQALKLDPDVFEHRGSYGVVLQEKNVEDRAKFHYYMAKMYANAGANDRALQYLRMALEEGLKERKKVGEEPEFAALRELPAFKELLALEPKVL
jgi:tetratricopeptide (TPR) repeat protein